MLAETTAPLKGIRLRKNPSEQQMDQLFEPPPVEEITDLGEKEGGEF